MTKEKVEAINKLLVHPEETAGALMTTEFCKFLPDATCEEVLSGIRQKAQSTEGIYYIYTVNEQGILTGVTTLRKLLATHPQQKISNIMQTQLIKVRTSAKQQRVVKIFVKYGFGAIPVVDTKDRLVGIIMAKDALGAVISQLKHR
jgi:magnesium transporter